ncbi:S8 family peptidase [Fluviispira vulneris]|uniref:S8 family peptidase n=1 Tax=Fluviispira vulneris TaxID=2763012 RepID=UPI00164583FB|nr:S8 family serine peptidase [Fluviispira vulneris]
MHYFKSIYPIVTLCFFLTSCGSFNPFNSTVDTTSDGSYVIESGMSDSELLTYGQKVIYRYKSVPNMIAVKSINIGKKNQQYIFSRNIYTIPDKNRKIRSNIINTAAMTRNSDNCSEAYCEARFNEAYDYLQNNNIALNPIDVAIVDSGVVPATLSIQNALASSSNISGDTNINNWASHATFIASVLAGSVSGHTINNAYAKNAKIHSVKISFSSDNENVDKRRFGSLQISVALDEAISLGAKIVNLSFAYSQKPDDNVVMAEKIVMANALKKGVIFVCAAGNDGKNIDDYPVFPASYDLNNIIVVGSHDSDLSRADTSNYGKSVDLSAQGALMSLNDKNGSLQFVGGTSFAAPLVVSALSIYYGLSSQFDVNTTLHKLFASTNIYYNSSDSLQNSRYGRLDVKKLLESVSKN